MSGWTNCPELREAVITVPWDNDDDPAAAVPAKGSSCGEYGAASAAAAVVNGNVSPAAKAPTAAAGSFFGTGQSSLVECHDSLRTSPGR
ncbi:hypothetical protein [Nesterenkonia salmonea]|uniref:hypothetical protein n=1 Tax=Nesterenkonia salmonea TaxID=1804987 RepID=UPI001FB80E53|nr:hypothetical protein [Nesterenkonia salmonea]